MIPSAQIFRLDHRVVDAGNSDNSPGIGDDDHGRNHPDINMGGVSYKPTRDPCGLSTLLSCAFPSPVIFMRIPREAPKTFLSHLSCLPSLPPSRKNTHFVFLLEFFLRFFERNDLQVQHFNSHSHPRALRDFADGWISSGLRPLVSTRLRNTQHLKEQRTLFGPSPSFTFVYETRSTVLVSLLTVDNRRIASLDYICRSVSNFISKGPCTGIYICYDVLDCKQIPKMLSFISTHSTRSRRLY